MATEELTRLLERAKGDPELPSPAEIGETVHQAFRACIEALSALTVYRVAAEVEGLTGAVAELEQRHAFLRHAIAEFSLWQRELRGLPGPAPSGLELADD